MVDTENGSCPRRRLEPVSEGRVRVTASDLKIDDLKIDDLKIDMPPHVP